MAPSPPGAAPLGSRCGWNNRKTDFQSWTGHQKPALCGGAEAQSEGAGWGRRGWGRSWAQSRERCLAGVPGDSVGTAPGDSLGTPALPLRSHSDPMRRQHRDVQPFYRRCDRASGWLAAAWLSWRSPVQGLVGPLHLVWAGGWWAGRKGAQVGGCCREGSTQHAGGPMLARPGPWRPPLRLLTRGRVAQPHSVPWFPPGAAQSRGRAGTPGRS